MERFAKSYRLLVVKRSIVNVWRGSEHAPDKEYLLKEEHFFLMHCIFEIHLHYQKVIFWPCYWLIVIEIHLVTAKVTYNFYLFASAIKIIEPNDFIEYANIFCFHNKTFSKFCQSTNKIMKTYLYRCSFRLRTTSGENTTRKNPIQFLISCMEQF